MRCILYSHSNKAIHQILYLLYNSTSLYSQYSIGNTEQIMTLDEFILSIEKVIYIYLIVF